MTVDDFWLRVDKNGPVIYPELGNCWIWTGSKATLNKYGPHRTSWSFIHGPIPDGKYICHHCDNPPCVRPSHLFLGTPSDNVADMLTKGRNRPHDGGWNRLGNEKRRLNASARMKGNRLALGYHLSPEHIEAIRKANLSRVYVPGYKHTAESIEKIRQTHLGRKRSEETRQKMRNAQRKRRAFR